MNTREEFENWFMKDISYSFSKSPLERHNYDNEMYKLAWTHSAWLAYKAATEINNKTIEDMAKELGILKTQYEYLNKICQKYKINLLEEI